MIVMLAVASLCTAALILSLLASVCRYREASWFASELCVLCFATPVAMLFAALGVGSLAWVGVHGGLAMALRGDIMIGSAVIIALFAVAWRLLSLRLRGSRGSPAIAASASLDAA